MTLLRRVHGRSNEKLCAAARQAGHVSKDAESYTADYSTLDLKVESEVTGRHRLVTARKANDFASDNCVTVLEKCLFRASLQHVKNKGECAVPSLPSCSLFSLLVFFHPLTSTPCMLDSARMSGGAL